MLIAVLLFLLNGVVPTWVYKNLGSVPCVAVLVLAIFFSIIGCALAHDKLGDIISRRVAQEEATQKRSNGCTTSFDEISKKINPNFKGEQEKKKTKRQVNRDPSGEKVLIYFHMFIGIISAIIFAAAVPNENITIMEFAKYAAIPAVFMDLIYFFDSLDIYGDFVTALLSAINQNVLGWGLSVLSIAIMAGIYVILYLEMMIQIVIIIIIVFFILKIRGIL